MKKRDLIIILIVFLALGISLSYAASSDEEWGTYQLNRGYSIEFPSDWICKTEKTSETWIFSNNLDQKFSMIIWFTDNVLNAPSSKENLLDLSETYMESTGFTRVNTDISATYTREATNNYLFASLTTGWIGPNNEYIVLSTTQEQSDLMIISTIFPSIDKSNEYYDEYLEILGTLKNNSLSL